MARSRRRGGGDLARLCLESGYIHHGEAPPIDVAIGVEADAVSSKVINVPRWLLVLRLTLSV